VSDENQNMLKTESSFCSEAMKTENPATVQCDAFQIEVFSQQEPLIVPATSLLVAIRV
jgi:hypothetical protein